MVHKKRIKWKLIACSFWVYYCFYCCRCYFRPSNQIKIHCLNSIFFVSSCYFTSSFLNQLSFGFYFCGWNNLMTYKWWPTAQYSAEKWRNKQKYSRIFTICRTLSRSVDPCGLSFSVHLFSIWSLHCSQVLLLLLLLIAVFYMLITRHSKFHTKKTRPPRCIGYRVFPHKK